MTTTRLAVRALSHRVTAPTSPNHHRSVGAEQIPFVGWKYIEGLVKSARAKYGLEISALLSVLFTGGFRISEVVMSSHSTYSDWTGLKPENLDVDKGAGMFRFQAVTVEKKYKKVAGTGYLCHETGTHVDNFGRLRSGIWDETHKHFQTSRRIGEEVIRSCSAPLFEPLIPTITEYSDTIDKGKFLFQFNRQKAWRYIVDIDPNTWPHWFRSQRASQLGARRDLPDLDKRGYGFNSNSLQKWFNWESSETAKIYAHQDPREMDMLFPSRL